jgi:5-methyltetrahydrofolate--homocysteine methyltransferase
MSTLVDAIREGRVRVGDGAMGTMLQEAGLDDGGAPELWNVERPEVIAGILDQYASAGSRLITTNTFGGTRPRLAMHGLEDRVTELNEAAARVARSVADAHPETYVLGDVGPSGDLMEPMGTLTPEGAVELFSEQISALAAGGADAILIETMSDLSEVEAAIAAARAVAPGLPVIATMSFDTNLRTMMGVTPANAVVAIAGMGADVVGANCGRGVDEMRVIAGQMAESRPDGTLLIMQSNAGLPVLIDGEFRYTGTPDEMAAFAIEMRGIGIDVLGACCGSSPAHIAAISAAIS